MPKNHAELSIGFLFDDTLDSNDGVAQQVKRLGEWLSRNGHQVVYFCGETKQSVWAGGRVYSLAKNIKVQFNGNRLSMPMLSRSSAIRQALAAQELDILHVQIPYSPLLAQRVIARSYGSLGIVGTFHILPSGFLADFGSRLLRLVQWRSLKKFDYMISVSSAAAEFARKTFGFSSSVIPNMIDLSSFRQIKAVPSSSAKRIVFLGRLVKRKGCAQLIEAFALSLRELPDVELVIAGDGVERAALVKLVAELGLTDKVTFLGYIDEQDKPALLASASVACFPALYGESFGVVLIEAMAAGAGVVLAGDNPGYRTVMVDQPDLLVDPRDTKLLAASLVRLLSDDTLVAKLHAWQEQQVKQYDVELVGQRVLAVYRQVIAKRAQNRHN